MRLLLAVLLLAMPACTISYYGQEEVETAEEPALPAPPETADAAIPTG